MESVRALQDVQEDLHRRGAEDATQDHPTHGVPEGRALRGGTPGSSTVPPIRLSMRYRTSQSTTPRSLRRSRLTITTFLSLRARRRTGCSSCKERETNPWIGWRCSRRRLRSDSDCCVETNSWKITSFVENYVTSEGAFSHNVSYLPLPITRYQDRFHANNYFE